MRRLGRWLLLVLVAGLALQLFFIGRIALMSVVDPQSTAFQRSEAWRIANTGALRWRQDWRDYDQISDHLQRAAQNKPARPLRIRGGSTITQQLAKNLLLSGERTLLRKGQELVLTYALEHMLTKRRILEIYLNSVEWGEGVFGAEAAAQHYFKESAAQLTAWEAARLAVMLPRPRHFEQQPKSRYLASRTTTIVVRMRSAELP